MAEIELVIKLSERDYEHVRNIGALWVEKEGLPIVTKALLDGIPLPKGHGVLKDADGLLEMTKSYKSELGRLKADPFVKSGIETVEGFIKEIPTIIEADKAESEEQENDIPWYLKIFNQDILNEYQKRMSDASPEEVPYNDKGSSIHSEVYNEENNENN